MAQNQLCKAKRLFRPLRPLNPVLASKRVWANIVFQLKGALSGNIRHWGVLAWGVFTSKPKAIAALGFGLLLALSGDSYY